jgi:hypothetical protein
MAPFSTLDGEEFPFQAMPWKIASFDLDGTPGARHQQRRPSRREKIGHLALIRDLEAQYYAGTISNAEFAALDAAYFQWADSWQTSLRHLEDIPVIGEIEKTVRLPGRAWHPFDPVHLCVGRRRPGHCTALWLCGVERSVHDAGCARQVYRTRGKGF